MAAIEVKLRQLQFRQYNEFVPTAHQMTLNEHAFYEAMRGDELEHYPGEYAEVAYSIKELCTELEKFVASKSLAGAAAIGAAGRGGGQSFVQWPRVISSVLDRHPPPQKALPPLEALTAQQRPRWQLGRLSH